MKKSQQSDDFYKSLWLFTLGAAIGGFVVFIGLTNNTVPSEVILPPHVNIPVEQQYVPPVLFSVHNPDFHNPYGYPDIHPAFVDLPPDPFSPYGPPIPFPVHYTEHSVPPPVLENIVGHPQNVELNEEPMPEVLAAPPVASYEHSEPLLPAPPPPPF